MECPIFHIFVNVKMIKVCQNVDNCHKGYLDFVLHVLLIVRNSNYTYFLKT